MRVIEQKGQIVIKSSGVTYNICDLIQQIEGDSFRYIFVPHYNVIDLLPEEANFEGIPGLDLDLKKDKYYREGIPTFISERVPPQNRIDINEILNKNDLSYYDPMSLLKKDSQRYNGDNLLVIEPLETSLINIKLEGTTNLYKSVSDIIRNIALNNIVKIDNKEIDVKSAFFYLYPIYLNLYNRKLEEQRKSISNRKVYRGRPRKPFVEDEFASILDLYNRREISMNEALRILNISRSTFIRKRKLFQK